MSFSESLRKKRAARLLFFEIQMTSLLSTASGLVQTASEGLMISFAY